MTSGDSPNRNSHSTGTPAPPDVAETRSLKPTAGDEPSQVNSTHQSTVPCVEGERAAPPSVGQRIGDYELLGEIARGGMGVVYRARQRGVNRVVALKMTLAGQFAGDEERRRFLAEAEAAGQLDHPHIVPIFEVGEFQGQPYFSMGYVEGSSLKAIVANGPLPATQAAELTRTIALAVEYAHSRGIIHRDLKPTNVLIDTNGQPRVTDFGLAKRVATESGLTATGQILGTPSYMPPEQALGRIDQTGPASDVYSLGATLYHTLTGRPPFQASSAVDTLMDVIGKEPVPPRRLNSSVPVDLETICLKCLEKKPEHRYPSADALAEDLHRFLRDEPIAARPVGRVERAVRWVRRNRVISASGAAVALALLITTAVMTAAHFRESGLRREKDTLAESESTLKQSTAKLSQENQTLSSRVTEESRRAKEEADAAKRAAEEKAKAEEAAEREEYYSAITRAYLSVREFQHARAAEILERVPPRLRNWEHRYLTRLAEGTPLVLSEPRNADGSSLSVREIGFNSDAGHFFVVADDGSEHLWRLADGRYLGQTPAIAGPFACHLETGRRASIVYSAEGARGVRLREYRTNSTRELPLARGFDPNLLAFSPNGRFLAIAAKSNQVVVRDLERDTERTLAPNSLGLSIQALGISSDGETLAACSREKCALWSTKSGEAKGNVFQHHDIKRLWFSPDGTRMALSTGDGQYRLLDAESLEELYLSAKESSHSTEPPLAFSPDGLMLSCHLGKIDVARVAILDLFGRDRVTLRSTFHGHRDSITALAFSPDGTTLASRDRGGTIRLWPLRDFTWTSYANQADAQAVAISPDGGAIATSNFGRVTVLDRRSRRQLWTADVDRLKVDSLAFSPNGLTLAIGGLGGVRMFDARHGKSIWSNNRGSDGAVAFSAEGERLFHHHSNAVVAFDPKSGEELARHEADPSQILRCIAVASARSPVAVGGFEGRVTLLDFETLKPLRSVSAVDKKPVSAIAFDPDGRSIVVGGWDSAIRRLRIADLSESQSFQGNLRIVKSVLFAPSGDRLFSASDDGALHVWDAVSGRQLISIDGMVSPLLATPSIEQTGHELAVGTFGGKVHVIDSRLPFERIVLPGLPNPASGVGIADDPFRLVTRDTAGEVLLWDLDDIKPHEGPIPSISFEKFVERSAKGELTASIDRNDSHLIRVTRDYRQFSPGLFWEEWGKRIESESENWHLDRTAAAEMQKSWFGAAFHLQRLPRSRLEAPDVQARLKKALANLAGEARGAVASTAASDTATPAKNKSQPPVTQRIVAPTPMAEAKPIRAEEFPRREILSVGGTARSAPDLSAVVPVSTQYFTRPGQVDPGPLGSAVEFEFRNGRLVLRMLSGGWWRYPSFHRGRDFVCEVTARTLGREHSPVALDSRWCISVVSDETDKANRGFEVGLTQAGKWSVRPFREDPEPQRSPWRTLSAHPAIRPGSTFNTVRVTFRGRRVWLHVNGSPLCEPFMLDDDLGACRVHLSLEAGGWAEAEFDQMTVWKADDTTCPPDPPKSSASSASTEPAVVAASPERQRAAAEWVLGLGGNVTVLSAGRRQFVGKAANLPADPFRLVAVHLTHKPNVTDADLARFDGCTNLERMNLQKTSVTGKGFEKVQGLISLDWLLLHDCPVTDESLAGLSHLTTVTHLGIGRTKITNAGLARLKPLQSLCALGLAYNAVDDDGIEHVAALPNLQELYLEHSRVRGLALDRLEGLKHLQKIDLRFCSLADDSISKIAQLREMRFLAIDETPLSGSRLHELASLGELQVLGLGRLKLTDADLGFVAGYQQMREFYVWRTAAGNETLRAIASMPRLRIVCFDGGAVTDEGLSALPALPALRRLELRDVGGVTEGALKSFRGKNPKCAIVR